MAYYPVPFFPPRNEDEIRDQIEWIEGDIFKVQMMLLIMLGVAVIGVLSLLFLMVFKVAA